MLKRTNDDKNQISLERVIGVTGASHFTLNWRPNTDELVYIAGKTVVFYSPRLQKQKRFILCQSPITCIAFDYQGNHIAVAESRKISIHDLTSSPEPTRIWSRNAAGGVIVRFLKYSSILVTVELSEPFSVRSYCWKTGRCSSHAVVLNRITAIDIADALPMFATCGDKSISLWKFVEKPSNEEGEGIGYLDEVPFKMAAASNAGILDGEAYFIALAFGKGTSSSQVFALTSTAILCRFSCDKKTLEKWVDLKLEMGFSIAAGCDVIVIAGAKGKVRLFTPDTISHIVTLSSPLASADIMSVSLTGDSDRLACFYADSTLVVWDIKKQKVVRHSSFHHGSITDLVPLPGNGAFLACSADGSLRVWNDHGEGGDGHEILNVGDAIPQILAISSEGRQIACGDSVGNIRQFHCTDNGQVHLVASAKLAHSGEVLSLDFSRDSSLLCSGGQDESINIFDVTSLIQPIGKFMDHHSPVESVRFASSPESIISSSSEGTFVRDVTSFTLEAPEFMADLLTSIPVIGCDRFALGCTRKGVTVVWEISTQRLIRSLEVKLTSIEMDSTGTLLVGTTQEMSLVVLDWFSGKVVAKIQAPHFGLVYRAKFSSNSTHLLSYGSDGCIMVWKLGKALCQMISQRQLERNLLDQRHRTPDLAVDRRLLDPIVDESLSDGYASEIASSNLYTDGEEDQSFVEASEGVLPLALDDLEELTIDLRKVTEQISNRTGRYKNAGQDQITGNDIPLAYRRSCWNDRRSLSPVRTSVSYRKRNRSVSPNFDKSLITTKEAVNPSKDLFVKPETDIDGTLAGLEEQFDHILDKFHRKRSPGNGSDKIKAFLMRVRYKIDRLLGPDESINAASLDPISTTLALDKYSGQLVQLIQTHVEKALSESVALLSKKGSL